MMYWLTEDSFVPMLTGIFVAVVLLLMAWSARNKVVMFVALFIAAATAAIVATEMAIVTDRETVTDMV
jgi:type II secretory pathway component PulL